MYCCYGIRNRRRNLGFSQSAHHRNPGFPHHNWGFSAQLLSQALAKGNPRVVNKRCCWWDREKAISVAADWVRIQSLTLRTSRTACFRARFSSAVSPFTRCGGCAVAVDAFCSSWRRLRPRDANTSDGISKFFVSFIGFTGCCTKQTIHTPV